MTRSVLLHALRYGLAAAIACAVGQWLGLHHLFWVLLTIGFVLQEQAGDTIRKSWQRVGGTLIGAALGWAIAEALGPGHELWLLAVLPALFLGIFLYVPVNYLVGVIFITLFVIFVYAIEGMPSGEAAYARALDALVAAALGIGLSLLIKPTRSSDRVREDLPEVLITAADRLRQETQSVIDGTSTMTADDYQAFVTRMHGIARSIASSRWEVLPWMRSAQHRLHCAELISALYRRIAAIHGLADRQRPMSDDLGAHIGETAAVIGDAMERMAARLSNQEDARLVSIEDLRQSVERAAETSLATHFDGGAHHERDARPVVFFAEMVAMLDDLEGLARVLELPLEAQTSRV